MRTRLNRTPSFRFAVLPFVTALSAFVMAACATSEDRTPEPTATPVPASVVLANTEAAMSQVNQFEFELTHPQGRTSLGDGMELRRAEGAVVLPDRLEVKAEVEFRPVFLNLEARVIGDQAWVTNPLAAGAWTETPVGESPLAFLDPAQLVSDVLAQLDGVSYPASGPTSTGPIILEGTVEAEALSALVASVEAGSILNVRMTIDRETSRLTEALITGRLQSGDTPDAARLIRLSGFDSVIVIEPPV